MGLLTLLSRAAVGGGSPPIPVQAVTAAQITTANAITITTTADIHVDEVIYLGVDRSVQTGVTTGITSITVSAGATTTWDQGSGSVRASTHDTEQWSAKCTTLIPAGSTITITWSGTTSARRVVVMAVFTNVNLATDETTSGISTGGDGGTSAGVHGASGTNPAVSASSANTSPDILSIVVFGSNVSPTVGAGYTEVAQVGTAAGSAERFVSLAYAVVRSAGGTTQSASATVSTGAWAAGIATYPIPSLSALAAFEGWGVPI